MPLTTAELLAIAVLKGDTTAALALADCITEDYLGVERSIPPVNKLTVPAERLRLVFFLKDDHRLIGEDRFNDQVRDWLLNGRPLILEGFERMEVYELPEPSIPPVTGRLFHLTEPDQAAIEQIEATLRRTRETIAQTTAEMHNRPINARDFHFRNTQPPPPSDEDGDGLIPGF